jgi:hypothetical protein
VARALRHHELVRNVRETKKVEVSEQGRRGVAVVDIDTLWRDLRAGDALEGEGVQGVLQGGEEWKMTMHTGVLGLPVGKLHFAEL